MNREEILQRILEVGIVPVIRASSSDDALSATEAVYRGGIPIVEITMTVPGALAAIRSLVQQRGRDILIGAGTVLDAQMALQCVEAGAQFLASPGLDVETVEFAQSQNKPIFAGALTPTEIIAAWRSGSDFVKVFPCNALGGPKYIASLKGPLPQVRLVPSGGVSLENIRQFIEAGASAVAVGGELVDRSALRSRKLETISQNAHSFIELIHKAREPKSGGSPSRP
ncbi:MAG TPA: bifunctional 4-hydroxy-2-oxoglutarate aldolase/2-dehydro-3-deoxy-phosphogluconate aldolase [Myxococcaceae bacterium]|nr:bifunctional 4-hydroxy-2-oxoglutarate aldolase/2-dehydro-3-deoxy-phosphogluconate aldolase [Myxococcaceae bacterium]